MNDKRNFTTVFETDQPYEILMVMDALHDQGIPVYGQQLSSSGLVTAMPQSPVALPGISWVAKVPLLAVDEARSVIAGLPVQPDAERMDHLAKAQRAIRGTVGYWVFWLIMAIFAWEVVTSVLSAFTV